MCVRVRACVIACVSACGSVSVFVMVRVCVGLCACSVLGCSYVGPGCLVFGLSACLGHLCHIVVIADFETVTLI